MWRAACLAASLAVAATSPAATTPVCDLIGKELVDSNGQKYRVEAAEPGTVPALRALCL